jgi:protein-S-isoprenylcysteine O-methyltransferase Ste14
MADSSVKNDNKQGMTAQAFSTVHHVLAHSYSFYFGLFLLAVVFDLVFPIKIFSTSIMVPIGFGFLGLATILIVWAQNTSRNLRKIEDIKKESFCRGPYCYSRSPTHWGLFLLMLGFGFVANALLVILSTLISFFVSRMIFLRKQESILVEKYGQPYREYQKSVKL